MKELVYTILCGALFFTGCLSDTSAPKSEYKKITSEQAKKMLDTKQVILLDVRTQSEFDEGHIENAVLIPYTEINQKAPSMLPDKNKKILVYCRSGRRSEIASRELVKMGYSDVYDFGGITDWKYEIVK